MIGNRWRWCYGCIIHLHLFLECICQIPDISGMMANYGQIISSTRDVRPIGRGGMADVLLATRSSDDQLNMGAQKADFRQLENTSVRKYRAVA